MSDLEVLPRTTTGGNRLGFALQLCWLRYLGFCPDDLTRAPAAAIAYVAEQLAISPAEVNQYGTPDQTRTEHAQLVQAHVGYHRMTKEDAITLEGWITARAMEHDRPVFLLQLAYERLRGLKLVRPGATQMERLVISARRRARQETAHLVSPLLTAGTKQLLDSLLVVDQASGRTPLNRLRTGAVSASPKAILDTLAKVRQLEEWHVKQWDVRSLSPNRRHLLARIAQRATAQALERMGASRRYPILLAFLHDVFEDRVDESVDLFDKCLSEAYTSAGNELKELRLAAARSANEKVILLRDISSILLDMRVDDSDVRWFIFKRVSRERLEKASTECEALMRPLRDDYFDLFATRYSHFRQFAPMFLDVLHFAAGREDDPLLTAIEFLRKLEKEKGRPRTLSAEDVPTAFVPANWKPYVFAADGNVNRRHYELALLWELRAALRAGDIWLAHSRRYANPKSYLIPQDRWPEWKPAVCDLLGGAPADGAERVQERKTQLEEMFRCVDQKLPNYGSIRMEDNKLVVDRIRAEEDAPSLKALNDEVDARLPLIELADLLLEVDSWTGFTSTFQHPAGRDPRTRDVTVHCYASLIAQARNLGLVRMAQASDLTYMKLAWVTTWYLREETLKAANVKLVNYHHHLPLSGVWGGGTLSSSDGQRFPSSVKNVMAAAPVCLDNRPDRDRIKSRPALRVFLETLLGQYGPRGSRSGAF